jgi:hypothetical protein
LFFRSERRLLAGLAVVTACSWGRLFDTGSLKVDQSYPSQPVGLALFAALIAGWGLAVAGWHGVLADPPRHPRRTAFFALGIASGMLPMLSNDVFSVLSYGSVAAQGHDVYGTAAWLPQGPFYLWLGDHWAHTPCVYGPTTLVASLPAALAGGNVWVGIALLRVVWFAPLALVMELSFRRLADQPFFHAMVWLNPLWIVEGPGQLHADLLGLVAIVAGVLLHRGGRVRTSFGLYAVALLGKYSFGPAGLWFWLSGAPETRERAQRLGAMTAIFLALASAFYAPFWHGLATVTGPLQALGRMNPGGSITEVLGIVVQWLRTGTVTAPDMAVPAALTADRAAKEGTWAILEWIQRLVFLTVAVRVLPAMLRKTADERTIAAGTGILTVALLTIASHRFQCWYLVAALPFFGLACPPAWKRWWVAVVALSVAVDFACVLERTSPLYPVWGAVSTGALVLLFVAWFRPRYLAFPGPASARPAATAPGAR